MSAQIKSRAQELYPIRTVASLTGVNPITLRAWERRYGLITPRRTETGHRLYSKQDIEVINRAVELQDQGIAIGQAAILLKQRLAEEASRPPVTEETWVRHQREMLEAITQFSETKLDLIYESVLAVHTVQTVIRKLIVPTLEEVGRRWKNVEGSVAEEHFFGVYMRNKLGALFHHRTRLVRGQKILAACLPGELHEVGLLLFALAAHDAGFRPVLLGANMPLTGLPLAAHRAECSAIVLSARCNPPLRVLEVDLPALVRTCSVPVFVGGAASVELSDAIQRAGAIPLGRDIDSGIRRINDRIGKAAPAPASRLQ